MKVSFEQLNERLKALPWTCDYNKKQEQERPIRAEFYQGLEVGDGVTYHLYSDSHACTIIKRTAKTITIQQDTAILSPDFKPEWVVGGFAGHCTNQDEQTYTYERNPKGQILTARWSDKYGAFMYLGKKITAGRKEFYDYNF
ncbi:MAG: hypothetical protein ACI4M8_02215 [Christensenellales bacterium]